ncbi:RidA family protein [Caenispirillum bisanense]|uniref:RidA family protein n=1 Tax=Caenispirillum bisanense TaxID=414052 RepID=UPI0031CF5C97
MSIKRISPGKRLSEAVVHGNTVYLAGQVADDASLPAEGQMEQVVANIDRLLKEVGSDKSKLLSATVYVADMAADFEAVNRVWDAWIDRTNPPARAAVQAPLARKEWLVEVVAIAALD